MGHPVGTHRPNVRLGSRRLLTIAASGLLLAACVEFWPWTQPEPAATFPIIHTARVVADDDLLVELARAFYADHNDDYDMLVLWGGPEFTPESFYYKPIQNDVPGIGYRHTGPELFDHSTAYGSTGRLQGIIWMGGGWMTNAELAGGPDSVLGILAQETAHRWCSRVHFADENGKHTSGELLGLPGHWSWFLDTGFSPMEGNRWESLGDDLYRAAPVDRVAFCPLDLYLMGLLLADQVSPLRLLKQVRTPGEANSGAFTPYARRSISEVIVQADPVEITIDQIIAAEGLRDPATGFTAEHIAQTWILVDHDNNPIPGEARSRLQSLSRDYSDFFNEASGGRSTVSIWPQQ